MTARLTSPQQIVADLARKTLAAHPEGAAAAVAARVPCSSASDIQDPYPRASGIAINAVESLLEVVNGLTAEPEAGL
jgi:hypothetical protein